jgi:hypothetical protein
MFMKRDVSGDWKSHTLFRQHEPFKDKVCKKACVNVHNRTLKKHYTVVNGGHYKTDEDSD